MELLTVHWNHLGKKGMLSSVEASIGDIYATIKNKCNSKEYKKKNKRYSSKKFIVFFCPYFTNRNKKKRNYHTYNTKGKTTKEKIDKSSCNKINKGF